MAKVIMMMIILFNFLLQENDVHVHIFVQVYDGDVYIDDHADDVDVFDIVSQVDHVDLC